jgi:cytidine deaminase
MDYTDLVARAIAARRNAYAPYSGFHVGAALLARSGRVYTGCNIENVAWATVCAERTALFKAVSEGEREFDAIAVVTHTGITPCGVCRQVMMEFAPDLEIIIADTTGNHRLTTLRALLPDAFTPGHLRGGASQPRSD